MKASFWCIVEFVWDVGPNASCTSLGLVLIVNLLGIDRLSEVGTGYRRAC
jgi:hypothetical protein